MSSGTCASCARSIDAAAKLCPYCGAEPTTGEKVVDTQAILQEVFHSKQLSTGESVLEFARQRQGIVLVGSLLLAFVVLTGIHQLVTARNASAVTNSPAVPLTEITDVANQKSEVAPVPLPEALLQFPYEGRPATLRTFIVERGAVAPAPPPAATGTAPQTTTGPQTTTAPPATSTAPRPLQPQPQPQRPAPQPQRQ